MISVFFPLLLRKLALRKKLFYRANCTDIDIEKVSSLSFGSSRTLSRFWISWIHKNPHLVCFRIKKGIFCCSSTKFSIQYLRAVWLKRKRERELLVDGDNPMSHLDLIRIRRQAQVYANFMNFFSFFLSSHAHWIDLKSFSFLLLLLGNNHHWFLTFHTIWAPTSCSSVR